MLIIKKRSKGGRLVLKRKLTLYDSFAGDTHQQTPLLIALARR